MGRFAQLNTNKDPAARQGHDIQCWSGCSQKKKVMGGGGAEIVIKFSFPEVSDREAFSGCWNHSAPTPRLIG